MPSRIEKAISRAAGVFVDGAQKRPWQILAVAFLVTVAAAWAAATKLEVDTDPNTMLSPELPFRATAIRLADAFPALQDNLVIVVENDDPEAARTATIALAGEMEKAEAFRHVFVPQISAFFEDKALFYVDVPTLEDIASRIEAAAPFLAAMEADPSLARVVATAALAASGDAGRDRTAQPAVTGETGSMLDSALAKLADDADQWLAGRRESTNWRDWLLGSMPADEEHTRYVILARPVLDFHALEPARQAVDAVRATVARLAFPAGTDVRVTGDLALITEEMVLAKREAVRAAAGSFLLVTTLLLATLLSLRLVAAIATTLLIGLAWTAGFAAVAIGHLNLLSLGFAVLFIGLGVDFGIHFGVRYRELRDRGVSIPAAISETGRSVGSSLVLCALTTAIGFYAFLPTRYAGVAELGLISGTGMFFSLVATLLILPAILVLAGGTAPRPKGRRRNRMLLDLPRFPLVYPRTVCTLAALTGLVAALSLPKIWFDSDPLNVRDPAAESVRAMRDLLSDADLSPWTAEVLVEDDEDLAVVKSRLEALPEVRRAVAVEDFLPAEQERKLDLFASMRKLLAAKHPLPDLEALLAATAGPAVRTADGLPLRGAVAAFPGAAAPDTAGRTGNEGLDALGRALEAAERAAARSPLPPGLAALYGSLQRVVARLETAAEPDRELRALEDQIVATLPALLGQLAEALPARRIEIATLPDDLRDRFIASGGAQRIEVYPAEDLNSKENLEAFADAVRGAAPRAGGAAVLIVESARAIVDSLVEALGVSFIAIALFLALLWRSGRDMVLALTPLLLATTWTAATATAIGLPMNFADIIVVPLLFGMGIDSGIHLVHRHRAGGLGTSDVLHTSTARSVVFSSLTTVASFASLAFSAHRGTASLGLLLTIGMSYTLLANLFVLPALLAWLVPAGGQASPRATR
jgi:predicted RND superfamily exporter protein